MTKRIATPAAQNATKPDPRVGLKPGFDDAGTAAKNIELVSHMPKPEGFSDPTGAAVIVTTAATAATATKTRFSSYIFLRSTIATFTACICES